MMLLPFALAAAGIGGAFIPDYKPVEQLKLYVPGNGLVCPGSPDSFGDQTASLDVELSREKNQIEIGWRRSANPDQWNWVRDRITQYAIVKLDDRESAYFLKPDDKYDILLRLVVQMTSNGERSSDKIVGVSISRLDGSSKRDCILVLYGDSLEKTP